MIIDGVKLVLTCGACPEQYDAYLDDRQIGYMRLRHGVFTVDYPDHGGAQVYCTTDLWGDGEFWDAAERKKHLTKAVKALLERHVQAEP
jgi:hypothetical protein